MLRITQSEPINNEEILRKTKAKRTHKKEIADISESISDESI